MNWLQEVLARRGILTTMEHLLKDSQREQSMKSLFHSTSHDRKRPGGQLMSSILYSIVRLKHLYILVKFLSVNC